MVMFEEIILLCFSLLLLIFRNIMEKREREREKGGGRGGGGGGGGGGACPDFLTMAHCIGIAK